MKKVYLLKVHSHNGGYYHSNNDHILTALDSIDESKRQYIKDTIEKNYGYFDGDAAVILDEVVTKLLEGKSCTLGSDEYTNITKIVEMWHEDADYTFSIVKMNVY